MKPLEGYGENPLALAYHGLRDRLAGRHGRANARRGYLRPPAGSGRVVWLQAGHTPHSVLLSAELLAALRERRQDIRLVLTFEEEYPELIKPRLRGGKIGLGYGPCATARALDRTVERLEPLGVLCIGRPVARHLAALAATRGIHLVAVDTLPDANLQAPIEAAYPSDGAQASVWTSHARYVAPPADPMTILTPAQVEPTFGALVRGAREPRLLWVHGGLAHVRAALAAWRRSPPHGESVLFVSLAEEAPWPDAPAPLSGWQREAVAPGTVLYVDAPRWLPAVAASADAVYLETPSRAVLWHALAGGAPVWLAGGAQSVLERLAIDLPVRDPPAFFAELPAALAAPQQLRPLADAGRRAFWQARRQAGQVVEELLQRVYDW
ncbi:hypothetical protein HUS23_14075 [Ectothiorhodospiraceae bacterium 2226]|nr:hypothetical protein HUS23_14075 [Ectothiorhodospiraceae bacterium 2226]